MTSRIDYSKWDKIDVSSSDEEEENVPMPRVTKLETPGTVTRSADGTISLYPSSSSASATPDTPHIDAVTASDTAQKRTQIEFVKAMEKSRSQNLTKNGGEFRDPKTNYVIRWAQDRNEIIISISFDPSTISPRNIQVEVIDALPFSERYSAVGGKRGDGRSIKGSLVVSAALTGTEGGKDKKNKSSVTLLSGELPHFIHLPEDEDEVEWEIDTCEHCGIASEKCGKETKLIRITLRKAVPMQGLSVWWSQPLLHCPEIDVTEIKDRSRDAEKQEAIKSSWDEAHRLFMEKIKSREKQVIDIDNNEDSSS